MTVKLIIQIPCYNEEAVLADTLAQLPRTIPGIDIVEWLVINDGSRDRTVEVAIANGVDHIVDLPVNLGLAHGFMAGLRRALHEGADIIVNTDADNQYNSDDIPKLVEPILRREAQFVIGDRPIQTIAHFSKTKRILQRVGSRVVQLLSGTRIQDAPSGFRALSREAALRLNIFDSYTYTIESIIQAGQSGIRITSVPIRVNGETRPSKLVKSIPDYIRRQIFSMLRAFFVYQPGRTFFVIGAPLAALGVLLAIRWIVLISSGSANSHVPSLIAAATVIILAALCLACGLLGELFAINRKLLQDLQYSMRESTGAKRETPAPAQKTTGELGIVRRALQP